MAKTYTVKQGDCLISISHQAHLSWKTVWEHPENERLRIKRRYPNILKPGDKVFLPDLELKEYTKPTEQRHSFVVDLTKVDFTLTLLNLGKPRANEKYKLIVDGQPDREGTTDDKGTFTEKIPVAARTGLLLLGEKEQRFELHFGCIDPIDEISGVQTRLFNLGFYHGSIGDQLDDMTTTAIAEFQRSADLAGNGELTEETRKKLVEVHGS
jgi:N-acetylmuramoyl-L-alanine amidase